MRKIRVGSIRGEGRKAGTEHRFGWGMLGCQCPWGSQEELSHRQLGILAYGTKRGTNCRYRSGGHELRGVAEYQGNEFPHPRKGVESRRIVTDTAREGLASPATSGAAQGHLNAEAEASNSPTAGAVPSESARDA